MKKPFSIDTEKWMCGSYYAMGMAIKAAFAVPFLTVSAAVFVKQGEWVIWRYIMILAAAVALGALLIRGVSGRVKNNADTAMAWLVDADTRKQTVISVQ